MAKKKTNDFDYSYWSRVIVFTIFLTVIWKLIIEAIFLLIGVDPLDLFQDINRLWLGSLVSAFMSANFLIIGYEYGF